MIEAREGRKDGLERPRKENDWVIEGIRQDEKTNSMLAVLLVPSSRLPRKHR
jgi:hypothetical protein